EFAAVPHEIIHDIAAISEVIHDVLELRGMLKPDRMAKLVNAGEIHNGLTQKIILNGAAGNRLSLYRNLRHNVNNRARFAVYLDTLRFAVESFICRNPSNAY